MRRTGAAIIACRSGWRRRDHGAHRGPRHRSSRGRSSSTSTARTARSTCTRSVCEATRMPSISVVSCCCGRRASRGRWDRRRSCATAGTHRRQRGRTSLRLRREAEDRPVTPCSSPSSSSCSPSRPARADPPRHRPSILDRAVAADVLLTEVVCILGGRHGDQPPHALPARDARHRRDRRVRARSRGQIRRAEGESR